MALLELRVSGRGTVLGRSAERFAVKRPKTATAAWGLARIFSALPAGTRAHCSMASRLAGHLAPLAHAGASGICVFGLGFIAAT